MKSKKPPQLSLRFFRWFCHPKLLKYIEGDLLELYEESVREKGKRKADLKFVIDVLLLFRPGIIKPLGKSEYELNYFAMFRHNFLIAIRTFNRHRTSFLINLVGLSTGLACTLLVYLWVSDEWSIDKFNTKDSQLYQVMQNFNNADGVETIEGTQGLLASALAQEMPEVESATTVVPPHWFPNQGVVSFGNVYLKASPQFISKEYFSVFTCTIAQGDNKNLLPDITSIAISEELALKLFNSTEDVLGKIVQWNHHDFTNAYHVTGIFEKLPSTATSQFDILFSYDLLQAKRPDIQHWGNSDPSTFLILKSGTDLSVFNRKINTFLKSKEPKGESTLFVQRFSDRYLNGSYVNGSPSGGRIFYVQLISIIGILILIIACINFMNLSTAKATRRIKEIGVKKAIGAGRKTLIWQYLSESTLISLMSLLLSLVLVHTLLPQFNLVTGKSLVLTFTPLLLVNLGLILLLTSILAGGYPAFYLSAFNSVAVLKGKLNSSVSELFARKGLVVFQFIISVVLIAAVVVVHEQMEYIQSRNLGYKKDNIITFEMEGQSLERLNIFRSEIIKLPNVINAGTYYHNLTGDHGNINLDWDGKDPNQKISFVNLEVGYDFIETMGIEFKEGGPPSQHVVPESQIVLNEAAIEAMGMKEPIGKTVRYWGVESQIVGVTRNFNFESLHEEIKPCFFRVYPVMFNFLVKVQGGSEKQVIQQIEKLHKSFSHGYPFDYKFLDENYNKLYSSEQKVSILSRYFAFITIVISCLGLLGLAAFTAERRFKEIGIRKVLGSSEFGIVCLLSGDFVKIVVSAIVIAVPISYFITSTWLERFAFRIELHWWYFAGAGLMALLIALLTVSSQAILAAKTNPVKSLQSE